ncbi:MAG: hypothetical protein KDJ39_13440 [Gammaproteobacteria bacterium]|nr:hypothetical protein [Gammaproteobacteria bacterium]
MPSRAIAVASLIVASLGSGGALALNPFESFGQAMQNAVQGSQPNQPAPAPAARPNDLGIAMAGERRVVYEGYSKEMLPVKQLLADGQADQALKAKMPQGKSIADLNMLDSLEVATLAIDAADLEPAKEGFQKAEMSLNQKEERSTIGGLFSGTRDTVLSTLTGNAELGEYEGAGYERVLMLNYKSIAHLLDGERSAYNVTRRAIDLQNIEKAKFDELVREAKAKIAEEEAKQKQQGKDLNSFGLDSVVEEQYQSTERQALKVPDAFVNPFGFYIAGVVQELDSYEDKSLRDNARISYAKALELNPKSDVIKQAVADMKKPAKKGMRLVNVIVGDGFAPEKKLLKFDLRLGASLPTEIELPVYEPVASKIARVEIQTTSGKRYARASEVADIAALALRFQKDAGPIQQLRMMTTVIRNVIEGQAWNNAQQQAGVFGSVFGKLKEARDEVAHPDMRSWSTLPSRLLAARVFVPKSVSQIQVVAYDAKGRKLASKVVTLDKDSHNVVYTRVIDNTIYATSSKKMWVRS